MFLGSLLTPIGYLTAVAGPTVAPAAIQDSCFYANFKVLHTKTLGGDETSLILKVTVAIIHILSSLHSIFIFLNKMSEKAFRLALSSGSVADILEPQRLYAI